MTRKSPYSTGILGCLTQLCVFALACLPSYAQEAQSVTSWTSAAGKTIEADFVKLTDDGVVLKLSSDGREAEVPFASLSLESRLQAIQLGKAEEFSKPLVRANIVPPMEIPPLREMDVDAMLVSPFSESQSLQEFIDTASVEIEKGNLFIFWHMLPEKMQTDVIDLAAKGMETVGSGPIVQIKTLLKDLNTIVTEKKEFVFATPLVADNPEVSIDLSSKWPFIQQFVASVSKEELWQSENFGSENLEGWMASFLAALGSNLEALNAILEAEMPGVPQPTMADMVQILREKEENGEQVAEIQISIPAVPQQAEQKLTVRKRKGKWLVVAYMNRLREGVDSGLEKIEEVDAAAVRTGIQTAMSTVIPPIGALARAETQEEFDAVLASLEPIISGMTSSIEANVQAGMTAGMQPEPDAAQGRRGGPGVGDRSGGRRRRSGGLGIGAGN